MIIQFILTFTMPITQETPWLTLRKKTGMMGASVPVYYGRQLPFSSSNLPPSTVSLSVFHSFKRS